ncbi:MAG: hypothetical protein HY200_08250 [Nitrospirae bacterium]|nr:hypothetical protein [Nitrospirota bacterium]MBI3594935.1 hypothetical protein [Nitrospirota bacterium]
MNIVETLNHGILFEKKVSQLFKQTLSFQKEKSAGQAIWKEIVVQKEKQILLLKKAVSGNPGQSPNASRIKLLPAREMEEGLAWIDQTEEELKVSDPVPAALVKLIPRIASFELRLIYSLLLKVYDLHLFKKDPELISLLNRHFQSLNFYLKKHHASPLNALTHEYPFLVIKADGKKGFREDELYQNLMSQKKEITLRLKNGDSYSGKLDSFDHFSLLCRPLIPTSPPISTLFLKESILSILIHD